MLRGGHNPARLLLRSVDGAEIHHLMPGKQLLNGRHNMGITAGAQNAVNLRHLFQNIPLIALGKAAGYQDFAHLPLRFQGGGLQNIIDGLALRGIDKAAGVDHHHIAAGNVTQNTMSGFLDAVHHPLAVHLILGTAKGNKTDICHYHKSSGKSSVSKERAFNACRMAP